MAPRPITPEETAHVDELIARGRAALAAFEDATQERVDRLCQAVAWAVANERTFTRLAHMGVEESGIGDPDSRIGKRFKVMGILRDVLRQKSIGVIEEGPRTAVSTATSGSHSGSGRFRSNSRLRTKMCSWMRVTPSS